MSQQWFFWCKSVLEKKNAYYSLCRAFCTLAVVQCAEQTVLSPHHRPRWAPPIWHWLLTLPSLDICPIHVCVTYIRISTKVMKTPCVWYAICITLLKYHTHKWVVSKFGLACEWFIHCVESAMPITSVSSSATKKSIDTCIYIGSRNLSVWMAFAFRGAMSAGSSLWENQRRQNWANLYILTFVYVCTQQKQRGKVREPTLKRCALIPSA